MKRTQTITSNQVLLMLYAVADIAGFTAWSSIREPHQVFTLLEAIFKGFDSIAKRQGIFKVETIGDCYVGTTLLLVKRGATYPIAMHLINLVISILQLFVECQKGTKSTQW
jgi:class 3 adenylate cyclase